MEDPSILCAVCLTEFDSLYHIPKFLSCHHSFCVICINAIADRGRLLCPICRKTSQSSNLQTNNELLELTRRIREDDLRTDNLRIQELTYGEQLLDLQDKIKAKESEILESEACSRVVEFPRSFEVIVDQQQQAINARNLIVSTLRTRVSTLLQELLVARHTILELESKLSS